MSDNPATDLVVMNNSLVAADVSDDIVAMAERRIGNLQRLISVALRITNAGDWFDQNGKPYLGGSGAEKVARLFGVKITDIQSRKVRTDDEKGQFYIYECTGTFSLPGGVDSIIGLGTCSSKDQFFAKQRDGSYKPMSEIDETNIMKSAYTNCLVNGITRLLGLRNLTWEQLKGAGIERGHVSKVEYKDRKDQEQRAAGKISEPQRKRLFAIASKHGEIVNLPAEDLIREAMHRVLSDKNTGHTSDILRTDYEAVCEMVLKLDDADFVGGGEEIA